MKGWAIHLPAPVPAASLRGALEEAMLDALRESGIIPPPKSDEPAVTPERRAKILAAYEALGGPIVRARPQMDAAIAAACVLADTMPPEALVLVSLYGHHDEDREDKIARRFSVNVDYAPEG